MLYAIEGSAMGGRMMSQRLRHAPPDGYFATQARLASRRWPGFIEELESLLTEADLETAVQGASCVFEAFMMSGRR